MAILSQDPAVLRRRAIVAGSIIVIATVALIVTMIIDSQSDDRKIQEAISNKINRNDVSTNIIMTDGDWTLANTAISSDNDNLSFTITRKENGENVIKFGPGSSFSLEKLVDSGVPDSMVAYFHNGIQWVYFDEISNRYPELWKTVTKAVIDTYCKDNDMNLKRAYLQKASLTSYMANPGQRMVFKFKINNEETEYTFNMLLTDSKTDITISSGGSTVYQSELVPL
jgi:hypothetical protein